MRQSPSGSSLADEFRLRTAPDPRADGGHRWILLAPGCVIIQRHVRGVKMHLRVPAGNYSGVVLTRDRPPAAMIFRVYLAHRDPDLSVTLLATCDQNAGIDAWHRWTAYFSLPALIDDSGTLWTMAAVPPRPGTHGLPAHRPRRWSRRKPRRKPKR